MTIEPEVLRDAAEAMNLNTWTINNVLWVCRVGRVNEKLNPPENPAQLVECIEFLLRNGKGHMGLGTPAGHDEPLHWYWLNGGSQREALKFKCDWKEAIVRAVAAMKGK